QIGRSEPESEIRRDALGEVDRRVGFQRRGRIVARAGLSPPDGGQRQLVGDEGVIGGERRGEEPLSREAVAEGVAGGRARQERAAAQACNCRFLDHFSSPEIRARPGRASAPAQGRTTEIVRRTVPDQERKGGARGGAVGWNAVTGRSASLRVKNRATAGGDRRPGGGAWENR